jgi:hypothetical protein
VTRTSCDFGAGDPLDFAVPLMDGRARETFGACLSLLTGR